MRSKLGTGRRLAFLLTTSALMFGFVPGMGVTPAKAQTASQQSYNFSIRPKPVRQALNDISRITGVSVVFRETAAASIEGNAVSGTMTRDEALAALLAGTGLSWSFSNANTVTITNRVSAAHNAPITADGSVVLETITVEGREAGAFSPDTPFQTPGSTAYISAEDIDRVPPSSQGDIFKSTPGVVSAGSRSGQGLNVNIRGLQGMNRVATLIDGTQQSTSSYTGYRGHTSSVFVDPDMIAGVDITKGPSDGPLGNGAMGGVVNMRTLNARDIVADGQEYGARVRATLGSNTKSPPAVGIDTQNNSAPGFFNGDSFNGSLAAATVQENFEFLAAVTRRKTGNYFAGTKGSKSLANNTGALSPIPPGGEVYNTSEDSFSLLFKGKAHFSEDASLELSYMRYENEHGELDDFPYVYSFAPPSQRELHKRKVDTARADFSYNPSGNPFLDLNVSAWLTNVGRTAPIILDGASDVLTYGVEAYNKSDLETPIGHLALTYGVQASLEDSDGQEIHQSYSWDPSQTFLVSAGPTGKRRLASVFSRAKLDVTEWLSFNAGLRYDSYHIGQGPGALAEYGSRSGGRLNPSLSVTVEPWDGVQFYSQYAQGWRPPSLREANFRLGTILYPNPALKPEKATNYEAGINVLRSDVLANGDSLKFKASYFNNTYNDYIVRDSIAQNWSEPRHWANIPKASFEGFEISFKYDADRVFLDAGVTRYTKVEFCHQLTGCASKALGVDYGGNYIPPEYLATVTGGVRLFDQKLTLGGRATFIGEPAVSEAMGGGYVTPTLWPKNAVFDLFGNYQVNDTASLNFSIENLTDRYYLDALSFTRVPAPGRTIRAGLTAKF